MNLEDQLTKNFAAVAEQVLIAPTAWEEHRRRVRRRTALRVAVGGALTAVSAVVVSNVALGTTAPPERQSIFSSPGASPGATAARPGDQTMSLRAVGIPDWWYTSKPAAGSNGRNQITSTQAFSFAGSPAFVVTTYVEAGEERTGVYYYRTADLDLGEGVTGSEGVQGGTRPLRGSPLLLISVWPTPNTSLWVWTHLPPEATALRYQYPGSSELRADVRDGVGAITVPRLELSSKPGILTALSASGDVLLSQAAPPVQ